MRNRTYEFTANGISIYHPFKINVNGSDTNYISGNSGTISVKVTSLESDFYYICNNHSSMTQYLLLLNKTLNDTTGDGNYDFYYGDISVNVTGDFDKLSVYCYYHGYMGGQELLHYA
jgi:hypothetical protein